MTKKLNKIAAVIVVASMLISCLCFGGSAIDSSFGGAPTGEEAMSIGLTASADSVEPGDVVTFTVRLSNNYNAVAMFWPVLYSTDFFQLVEGSVTSPIDNVTAVAGTTTTTTDSSFVPSAYADTHSVIGIQWIASGTADNGIGAFSSGVAADCFTLQLKVKEDATGTGTVLIPADYDGYYYSGVNDPSDVMTYYNSATPFNFTFADAISYTFGSAADPELVAAEGYNVKLISFVGDNKQYLCGFDVTEIIDNSGDFKAQFVVNNGTYTVSKDLFATGTVVTVYNTAGEVFAEYEIIFFGDLTGDGIIDLSDIVLQGDVSNFMAEISGANYYAADVVADSADDILVELGDCIKLGDVANYLVASDAKMQTHTP